jgi:hypothetical protein
VKLLAATFALLFALASPALAQTARERAPLTPILGCGGAFGPQSSHAELVKRFGPLDVTFEQVGRAEGEMANATVLYASLPELRVEIEWFDETKRARPSVITVFGPDNRWRGPLGIKGGMTIQELEKIAGKPFRINGFAFDVAGAMHIEGTKLEKLPGGCKLGGHFEIEGGQPPEHLKRFIGEVEIASNDKELLTLKPKLWIWTLNYTPPGF